MYVTKFPGKQNNNALMVVMKSRREKQTFSIWKDFLPHIPYDITYVRTEEFHFGSTSTAIQKKVLGEIYCVVTIIYLRVIMCYNYYLQLH